MKLLFDFITIAIFFLAYKQYGMHVAIITAAVLYGLQVIIHRLRYKSFDTMQCVTFGLIAVLGGSSLLFHNDLFFKWKPTALYWLFALVLWGSHWIGDKPLLERLLQKNQAISLPPIVVKRLSIIWGLFFILMGIANLYVAYTFSTDTWVNFKLFGTLVITLVFVIAQAIYLSRFFKTNNESSS